MGMGWRCGDDTGATGVAVGVGASSGWQASSSDPATRASMTTMSRLCGLSLSDAWNFCGFKNVVAVRLQD